MSLLDKASIVWPKGAPSKAGFVANWNPQTGALVNFPVTRATTKTYVGENGLIQEASANVLPRDFTDGGCGVFKIEPQRTNIFLHSDPTTGDARVESGVTMSANDWGVLGFSNKTTYPEIASTQVIYDGTAEINTQYTGSFYVKFPNGESVTASNFGTGSGKYLYFIIGGSSVNSGYVVKNVATNIYRVSVEVTTGGTLSSANVTGFLRTSANDDALMEITGFQIEKGATAVDAPSVTSYIPTAGSTVTRNADVPALTGAGALLNDSAGGIFIRGSVFDASTPNIIEVSNSSDAANERVLIEIDSTNITGKTTDGGVEQATINGPGATSDSEFAICYNYALNSFSIQKDGATAGTDSAGTTPSGLDQIRFTDGTNSFFGDLAELIIFNQRPDDTQGEAVTD
jgi:hypothetical protein